MQRRLSLALIVLSLAPVAQAQPERLEGRPPYDAYMPPEAVDHVVTLVVTPAGGPPRTEIVTITRSGAWQREDSQRNGGMQQKFADLERGVSINWGTRADGSEYLSAYQDPDDNPVYITRERTGETQFWAGSSCEMWRWRIDHRSYVSNRLTCITQDGIELWQGHIGYDGEVTEAHHALHVVRRKVAPSEVRLPPHALDWKRWSAGLPAGDTGAGYEVVLGGEVDGGPGDRITLRRRGEWTTHEGQYRRGRHLRLTNPNASLNFTDNPYTRSLNLFRHAAQNGEDVVGGPPVPVSPPRSETILGRDCIWWDTMPNMHDAGAGECRDADGLVLAMGATSRGSMVLSVRATSVSTSPPPEAAFAPSADIFSWIAD